MHIMEFSYDISATKPNSSPAYQVWLSDSGFGANIVASSSVVVASTWFHISVTREGDIIKLYFN